MIVQRPPANKNGESIVDSVLTTRQAKIERGRAAIEETSMDKIMKTAGLLVDQYVEPGKLYKVFNKSEEQIGLCTDFSINASASGNEIKISSQIVLEIPK